MTFSPTARRVFLAIALLLLVGLAWTGVSGGIAQLSKASTMGQKAQTLAQLAYGLFGLLTVATAFRSRRWAPVVRGCWVVSVSAAAGLASVVWGGRSLAIGLLSGAAASLIALAIVWLLHAGARPRPG